jgi:hypothetical protein
MPEHDDPNAADRLAHLEDEVRRLDRLIGSIARSLIQIVAAQRLPAAGVERPPASSIDFVLDADEQELARRALVRVMHYDGRPSTAEQELYDRLRASLADARPWNDWAGTD